MCDRLVGERLADDGDAAPAEHFHHIGTERTPGIRIEAGHVVERSLIGQEHVLRDEVALNAARFFRSCASRK